MKATPTRHGWVHMFITHRLALTLQLHNFHLFRTCRTSCFCTVAWQLARFQLTRHIARSLGDSRASCMSAETLMKPGGKLEHLSVAYFLWNISAKIIKTQRPILELQLHCRRSFLWHTMYNKTGRGKTFSRSFCRYMSTHSTVSYKFSSAISEQIPYLENIAYKCLHRQTNHAVASAVCRNSPHLSLLVVQRCGLIIVINYSIIIEKYFLISR